MVDGGAVIKMALIAIVEFQSVLIEGYLFISLAD